MLVALILVLCSIAVLIFFIHHVPMRIHINNVIERIGDRLIEEIDRRFPSSSRSAFRLRRRRTIRAYRQPFATMPVTRNTNATRPFAPSTPATSS
ncbi:DUF2254 family protein [Sphingomonas sp. MMS24-JH45]